MTESTDQEDPFLASLLDEVLAEHADLPPEALAEMRWILELAAKTHPTASTIVNRARPRAVPQRSGEQEQPGASVRAVDDDDEREGTGG